jgi:hypothetical protein
MTAGDIEHTPLAESERAGLRHYADGLSGEDWGVAVLIGSAVWNVERLEAENEGLREALQAIAALNLPYRDTANRARSLAREVLR